MATSGFVTLVVGTNKEDYYHGFRVARDCHYRTSVFIFCTHIIMGNITDAVAQSSAILLVQTAKQCDKFLTTKKLWSHSKFRTDQFRTPLAS